LTFEESIGFDKIKKLKSQMHWGSLSTGKPYAKWERQVTKSEKDNARQTNRVM